MPSTGWSNLMRNCLEAGGVRKKFKMARETFKMVGLDVVRVSRRRNADHAGGPWTNIILIKATTADGKEVVDDKKRTIKGNASIRCRSRSRFLDAFFGSGFFNAAATNQFRPAGYQPLQYSFITPGFRFFECQPHPGLCHPLFFAPFYSPRSRHLCP